MTASEIASKLKRATPTADGFKALCPAHEDKSPSLSITQAEDKVLLKCFAGCTTDSIVAALGIRTADLFTKTQLKASKDRIVATYDYQDETGQLLFQVCRMDPKDFRQRRPDGNGGWVWKMARVRRVPFMLPELIDAVSRQLPIYVCEGEKDVLALQKHGFAATCNPGGADKWQSDFADYFRRAEVVIVADKDEAGRRHAVKVAANLRPVASSVRVIEVPDANGVKCKDAADYFAAGGGAADLDELARTAPLWEPEPAIAPVPDNAPAFDFITADLRKQIIGLLMSNEPAASVRAELSKAVVGTLGKVGRFYYHADLRDFDSCLFFNAHSKRLLRIRSDAFTAWLSDWLGINRADGHFRFVAAAVETTALSGRQTTGIVPEAFWASRSGAIYLSNGDGSAAKITGDGVSLVDNGSDGVLFAAGKTLAPWQITAPRDAFESCSLFASAHCEASHGKDLLRLWLYSLPTNPRSKPPLCLAGDIGSGKTRTVKGFAELLGIPFVAQKVEEDAESNFWPCLNEGGLYCLDNADTRCRWLADALANAATDGCSQRRKLYTNSETVTLRARAWLAVTSANPSFANDAGLADRLLLVRMGRHGGESSDNALSDEILANRDAGLSHIAETLRGALADSSPVPGGLNARHPDFAGFAVRIGRALGREQEAIAALQQAEADKSNFCLENDPIGVALIHLLADGGSFTGTAAELVPKLIAIDAELDGRLSAKRLGKRLTALWPHLQKALKTCRKEADRNKVTRFEFRDDAGFAGFQMAFPQNPL